MPTAMHRSEFRSPTFFYGSITSPYTLTTQLYAATDLKSNGSPVVQRTVTDLQSYSSTDTGTIAAGSRVYLEIKHTGTTRTGPPLSIL
jgi:hypothetical protein